MLNGPLDWKARPSIVKDKVNDCWNGLNQKEQGSWSYNGDESYQIAYIKELALVKAIIKANPERSEFSILDIGAGNFQLGRALAKALNEDDDIPKNVRVNIIGVRGEANVEKEENQIGICHLYELGAFKVEDIGSELGMRIKQVQAIDLAISAWTFRHLVDPVGTFAQVYNLLNPKNGYFLVDGLYYDRETKEGVISTCPRKNMLALLQDLSEPFLIHGYNASLYFSGKHDFNPVLLKRTNPNPCQIQLMYVGLGVGHPDCASWCTTHFKELTAPMVIELEGGDEIAKFKGDKALHDFLCEHSVFDEQNQRTQYCGPIAPRFTKSELECLNQIYDVPLDAQLLIFSQKLKKGSKSLRDSLEAEEPVAYRTRSKTKIRALS